MEILAAALNGLTLVIMAAWIIVEVIIRAFKPVAVSSTAMLVVAVLGLLVNTPLATMCMCMNIDFSGCLKILVRVAHPTNDVFYRVSKAA